MKNSEKIINAMKLGELEKVKEYALLGDYICNELSYSQANFFSTALAFIGEKFGEQHVEEALRYIANYTWEDKYKKILEKGTLEILEFWKEIYDCNDFIYHQEEYEDRYELIIEKCAIGGRLIKDAKKYGVSQTPAKWNFNRENVPYYCSHCKVNKDILPKEWGYDNYDFICGVVKDEDEISHLYPCKMILYK
jgi:hypothetical protein